MPTSFYQEVPGTGTGIVAGTASDVMGTDGITLNRPRTAQRQSAFSHFQVVSPLAG